VFYVSSWLICFWFSRQFFVAHGGVIDEGGHDDGGLLEVILRGAVEYVHVGMVRARAVLQRILDELETGEADSVERLVVGPAGVGYGDGGGAHVCEGCQPLLEEGFHTFVALGVDSADLAAAVIQVEVAGE